MSRQQDSAGREARRVQVMTLYLARWTQTQIAKKLGVSQPTVNDDIRRARAEYRAERVDLLDRECDDLEAMERDAAMGFARTRDKEWLETRLRIKKRRAELLGMDAPKRGELKLSTDDIDTAIETGLAQLAAGAQGAVSGED